MRAAWYSNNGAAREVLVIGELPTPQAGPGEVRVKLSVSGVNPSDVKARRSRPLGDFDRVVPHSDGAGIIDQIGNGVAPGRLGERVWVWNGQWQRSMGTAAEYIVVPSRQAVRLPAATSFEAGACLGIPALTAFHGISLLGALQGRTVLVVGAASAVGHYATQIAARCNGARVIGTVGSEEKARHAVQAGAMETIDYKREPVAERIREMTAGRGVDAIIDMDFSSTVRLLEQGALAPHGTLVSYGSNDMGAVAIPFRPMLFNSISLKFFLVYELLVADRRAALEGITQLLENNVLDHTIGAAFDLDEIAQAHEAVESGRVLGNVIVRL
ncbi:MAG: NADPH:quinone reductase [Rhodocyclaceae bacterium]|nr:MAG: NADPH:quinone reductase [Rhodocyclaceae bacterium]